jgi:hypothetical protein
MTSAPARRNSRCSSRTGVGKVENYLGHERAALEIAAPLQLEEVALGAEDDVALETFEEGKSASHWAIR